MDRFSRMLLVTLGMLFAGHVAAQTTPPPRINTLQLKPMPAPVKLAPGVNPAAVSRLAPGVPLPVDPEAQVQAELKRLKKQRDDVNSSLAKVGANYTNLANTAGPSAHACLDESTTWNKRTGETYACAGATTCTARWSRWATGRSNFCEPGVIINSCLNSDECKAGSLCDTGKKTCVPR